MDAIFTIVAKNYIASAITLGKSVRKYNKNCDFIIVLTDTTDGISLEKIDFPVYVAENFDIPDFEQQSFMYDVVEFSTAVKPFFMLYLMNEKKYGRVLYLDPDTWVMDSLDMIWKQLENYDFVLTPHIVDMSNEPNAKEVLILDRGVFNLGFIGVRNTNMSQRFLRWWKARLEVYCFSDAQLFVDQKWVGYLPLFSDNYYVVRSKAYNMADWNYHEREIVEESGQYYIKNGEEKERLKFFHFSGVKVEDPEAFIRKRGIKITGDKRSVLLKLIAEYQKELIQNGYERYANLPYGYGRFSNGDGISRLHRRIYRRYREKIHNPFSAVEGNFYKVLKKEKLISDQKRKNNKSMSVEKEMDTNEVVENVGYTAKGKMFIGLMKLMIRVFGVDTYLQILEQLQVGTDIDKQSFLVSNDLNKDKK